jgi:uncharacterized membrane protein YfcA
MLLILIGILAGFYGALFGIGGGTIIVPALVMLGFGPRSATATSLAAIGATAVAGAVFYAFYGEVHPLDAVLIGIPATVGVIAGTGLQQRLHSRVLLALFSLLVAGVGLRLLIG